MSIMSTNRIGISIIVPFYYGNQYLKRLFRSVSEVANLTNDLADYEIVIINDSPEIEVQIPISNLKYKVISNEKNQGIQASRVNGLAFSDSEWVLFLDQDDELNSAGFRKQLAMTRNADVIVGNCRYGLGTKDIVFFRNDLEMRYLLKEERFLKIRNQIPSPGECLIRSCVIPDLWKQSRLTINGADDWMLWILLFKSNCKFISNPEIVYKHNDANGNNLSSDLKKMHDSALEMLDVLTLNEILNKKEADILRDSIEFKYYQDTNQMSIKKIIHYRKTIIDNVFNRMKLVFLRNR